MYLCVKYLHESKSLVLLSRICPSNAEIERQLHAHNGNGYVRIERYYSSLLIRPHGDPLDVCTDRDSEPTSDTLYLV